MELEQIKMPQLGESVTEGTISRWLVSVGDQVSIYDPIAEVMTDKVNAEIPSSFTGTIEELIAGEGDTLSVGETICTVKVGVEKDENVEFSNQGSHSFPHKDREGPPANKHVLSAQQKNKIRYSPAVLKLSQLHDIDLTMVKGTGAEGRITRKDLLKLIESGTAPKQENSKEDVIVHEDLSSLESVVESVQTHAPSLPSLVTGTGDKEIPITGVRKVIAANMVRSKHEAPHAWTMVEADVTNLVELRNSLKDEFNLTEGFNLSYFPFFVKAAAQALKEFPQVNSMWAGNKIVEKKDINISIAVATETALYVPVIKNCDEKTIKGIAREIFEYANKVRSGKITAADMEGGTFTVNNTGSFGSVQSMGIINSPQAALLQVESIVKRPVVLNNNSMAIRDMVNLCMSLDHRVLDGLICGRFLHRVKEILEHTSKQNTSIY